MEAIYSHVCPNCGGHPPVNEGGLQPEELQKEAERIARGLYNGSITSGSIDPQLTKAVALELRKAVIEGFGKDLPEIDYGTPDYNKLAQLEKNVFQFSGAKDYQQLKSMSLALKGTDGKQREYSAFKEEAVKISGEYNGTFLRAEYDTAIGSGQMAGKWVDFEQHQKTAPYLRYDTVGDDRVRDEHRLLDGVIKLITDVFWQRYYPPNGWRCRCDATQLLTGKETSSDKIQLPNNTPLMFLTNMGQKGIVFPDTHPYYVDCPVEILKQAQLLRDNVYSKVTRTKAMKADVYVGSLADPTDLDQNIQLSKQLAEDGEEVYIRPHTDLLRVKNPELQLGSSTGDFKVHADSNVYRFVKNSITSANDQQCNIPVIVLPATTYDRDLIWRGLRSDLVHTGRKKNITHVWLMTDKKLVKLGRADIVKDLKSLLP